MDEAFVPLHEVIGALTAAGELRSEMGGFTMRVARCEIETPVELDLHVGPGGQVEIGAVPPLYRVDTSLRPSYHALRFSAALDAEPGDA